MALARKKNMEQPQAEYKSVLKSYWFICFTFKDNTVKEHWYKTEEEMKNAFGKIKQADWETDKFVGDRAIFLLSEIKCVECQERLELEYVKSENDSGN